jgi:large subunit ribosomal protein L13
MKQTKPTKSKDIKKSWHLVDVKDKILGRASTEIASFLMGKSKPYFVRNLDCGDFVVVINASSVKVSGAKEIQKKYSRHSGYPGGYKEQSYKDLKEESPDRIIKFAVKGMLPQNKLRDRMLNRLFVFKNEEHPYNDKFSKK